MVLAEISQIEIVKPKNEIHCEPLKEKYPVLRWKLQFKVNITA